MTHGGCTVFECKLWMIQYYLWLLTDFSIWNHPHTHTRTYSIATELDFLVLTLRWATRYGTAMAAGESTLSQALASLHEVAGWAGGEGFLVVFWCGEESMFNSNGDDMQTFRISILAHRISIFPIFCGPNRHRSFDLEKWPRYHRYHRGPTCCTTFLDDSMLDAAKGVELAKQSEDRVKEATLLLEVRKAGDFPVDESYMTNIQNHLWMVEPCWTPAKDVIFSISIGTWFLPSVALWQQRWGITK